jgi:hypothetical protein
MHFLVFIPHTTPFNYGTIEIEIKSYHMGPSMHTTSLAHSRTTHKSRSGGGKKTKKLHHLIEMNGNTFVSFLFREKRRI